MNSTTTLQRRSARCAAMACTLALAGAAWAGHPGADDKFKAMDANSDGMVSASEHASFVRSMFDRMDTNRDGSVTAAEMDAGHKMRAKDDKDMHHDMSSGMHHGMSSADRIAKMDTNGDGALSASEHDTGAQAKFSELDTDGNGSLSRQELQAHASMEKSGK